MKNNVDVIIISFANNVSLKKMTHKCVQSILMSENADVVQFNIIVIESNKDLYPFSYPHTKTVYPKQKFGYHKYLNIGIKMTSSPYVCLCNNDLIFHQGWATRILNEFTTDEKLISASPLCSIYHPTIGINKADELLYGYNVGRELVGWCLFVKREIFKTIGFLDSNYKFWYSDNDFSRTLQKYSLKHALVTASVVDHLVNKTLLTKNLKDKLTLTYAERFYYEYKWEGRTYSSYMYNKRKYHALINKIDPNVF